MAKPTLPVVLQVGNTSGEIGSVELPFISEPAGKDAAGLWTVTLRVDHPEFRRRLAALLRDAAAHFEEVPVDGE